MLFPRNCLSHYRVELWIYEQMDTVSFGEALDHVGLVFRYSTPQIAGCPDIKRSVSLLCEDVNTGPDSLDHRTALRPLGPRFRGGDEIRVGLSPVATFWQDLLQN
jgi:hypothetical protein